MNHFLKNLLILSCTIAFFSCNDEFLHDKLDISGMTASAIVISPDWEADDYEFSCEGITNGDFTITSQPEWLNLDSHSGTFQGNVATIHASANAVPRFSKMGFYVDQMIVNASGKKYAVPLYYTIEGNPTVKVNRTMNMTHIDSDNMLQISNSGDGILLWDILQKPDWLIVNVDRVDPMSLILGNRASFVILFALNKQAALENTMNGTIILKTNDQNNPIVQIAISVNLGDPGFVPFENALNFGSSDTLRTSRISNSGRGILNFRYEGLPDWLSVSVPSGMLMPFTSIDNITYTCHRANLQPGIYTATFYLKTNAPANASVPITATVRVAGTSANIKALEGNIMDVALTNAPTGWIMSPASPINWWPRM